MTFLDLPLDVQLSVLKFCLASNPTICATSQAVHGVSIPLLYHRVRLSSLLQLNSFISPSRSSSIHSLQNTHQLTVKVPGGEYNLSFASFWAYLSTFDFPSVPGPSYLPTSNSEETPSMVMKASKAVSQCPLIRELSLEFYSISHSTFSTSSEFRQSESHRLEASLSQLKNLKRFNWSPPGKGEEDRGKQEKVLGVSIAIVQEIIGPLTRGLDLGAEGLEHFEMKNIMFEEKEGGVGLFEMLSRKKLLKYCGLESVTSVNPKAVALLALSRVDRVDIHDTIQIQISDGFLDSIWGPRLTEKDIEEAMRGILFLRDGKEGMIESIEKAMRMVELRVIEGGVGGMF